MQRAIREAEERLSEAKRKRDEGFALAVAEHGPERLASALGMVTGAVVAIARRGECATP